MLGLLRFVFLCADDEYCVRKVARPLATQLIEETRGDQCRRRINLAWRIKHMETPKKQAWIMPRIIKMMIRS